MKKNVRMILAALLACLMVFAAGCGAEEAAAVASASASASETVSAEEPSSEAEMKSEAEEPAEEAIEDPTDEFEEISTEESAPADTDEIDGLANPITEHASLEEINEIAGTNLCAPAVMGISDESFLTIDCGSYTIAEYDFSVNGTPMSLRGAVTDEPDISGIYGADGEIFAAAEKVATYSDSDVLAARWYSGGTQYVLSTNDVSIGEETFSAMVDEITNLVG